MTSLRTDALGQMHGHGHWKDGEVFPHGAYREVYYGDGANHQFANILGIPPQAASAAAPLTATPPMAMERFNASSGGAYGGNGSLIGSNSQFSSSDMLSLIGQFGGLRTSAPLSNHGIQPLYASEYAYADVPADDPIAAAAQRRKEKNRRGKIST